MLTRGAQITGVAVCSMCLSWISVLLRFYVRVRILKFFGKEDWLTVATMIIFTTLCVLSQVMANWGVGAHVASIPVEWLPQTLKYTFSCELLYVMTTMMAKISIGVYFLRLAGKRYQVIVIYSVMASVVFFSTMYFFFLVFQCKPVNYLWTQFEGAEGSCVSPIILADATYAHAAISAVTDWAFGILPVFFVWNLQMNPRTKISVALILSLGFFASTATIVRIVYIRELTVTDDYSWEGINLTKWSLVEPAIGITAAAIATLRPLFKNILSRRKNRTSELPVSHDTPRRGHYARPSHGQDMYSAGFADMLGLRRVGVTTVITAMSEADRKAEQLEMKRRQKIRKITGEDLYYSTSQTELNDRASEETTTEPDWTKVIKTTTIVTIEK